MSHDFIAFIDESGSEGDPEAPGGCEFLLASAVVVRRSNIQFLSEVWDRARRAERKPPQWRWRSFKEINSDSHLFLISQMIGEIPFRFATVIAHKPSLHTLDKKGDHGDLYHFISMLLLERISWICRDACKQRQDGDGTARILFSERKQIQYERFIATARNLGENAGRYESYTEWAHINLDAILAQPHGTRDGFRVADFVASAFGRAIEPKKHGLTDDRFIIPWSQQIYRPANGGCLSNGLKFYPMGCEKGLLTEDRFRWFTTHYSP